MASLVKQYRTEKTLAEQHLIRDRWVELAGLDQDYRTRAGAGEVLS